MSERSVYRGGLRGELWTASGAARLVLYRQLLVYSEDIGGDGALSSTLQVSRYA